MFTIDKISVVAEEAILYDGDQIAIIFKGVAKLGMTREDMNGGEISKDKQNEIIVNKEAIIKEIGRLGYQMEDSDEED